MDEDNISKSSFLEDNFSVDKYLSKQTQKLSLNILRNDLKSYGSELHTSMSEILRTETEGIVNLAENLTKLNSKITNLSSPIAQFQEEIRTLKEYIKSSSNEFNEYYLKKKSIAYSQDFLSAHILLLTHLLAQESKTTDFDLDIEAEEHALKRTINDSTFVYNYFKEKDKDNLNMEFLKEIENLQGSHIDAYFLKSMKLNNLIGIENSLRMYMDLRLFSRVEKLYREHFIQPALLKIFTTANIDKDTNQLSVMYEDALKFLNKDVDALHVIIKENFDLKGFNFIINSFWYEVDKQLRENLPNYTAPGNPELFQKRFISSRQFLLYIIKKCSEFHLDYDEKSFQEHLKCFNLPVYFEIRFQQIASKLETAIMSSTVKNYEMNGSGSDFKLKVTSVFWTCFQLCFNPNIFIDQLTSQFVKLSMLVLSRYLTWFTDTFNNNIQKEDVDTKKQFLVNALVDLKLIESHLSAADSKAVYTVLPNCCKKLIADVTHLNTKTINETVAKVQDYLINLIVEETNPKLLNITAIPRLYRRTNRNIPKEPSSYVTEALAPIFTFCRQYEEILGGSSFVILDLVVFKTSQHFSGMVQQVMDSVFKIEESLRRLKYRNMNVNDDPSISNADVNTDESKIREQIKLDVLYFVKSLRKYAKKHSGDILNNLEKNF